MACGDGSDGGAGDGTPPSNAPPVISVFAGSLQSPGSRDGIGVAAQFNQPGGVAQDSTGTIYVADTGNHTIRRIGADTGVSTIAGVAGQAGNINGAGAAARFSSPQGLAVDGVGNLYIADTGNNAVRRLSAAGVVSTVAVVDAPTRLAVDRAGVIYVLSDRTVHKVAPDGSVTIFPVTLESTFSSYRFFGIAVDGVGNVFLAEGPSNSSTITGEDSAIRKFDPQGRALPLGTAADGVLRFTLAADIAADSAGNLYMSRLGVFNPSPGIVFFYRNVQRIAQDGSMTLLAGPVADSAAALTVDGINAAARFADPRAIAVGPGGRVVVVETATSAVRAVDAQGNVSTLAGGNGSGTRDGTGTDARFNAPQGVAAGPNGSLYVVDSGNLSLRTISAAGAVTTVGEAGTASRPAGVAVARNGTVYVTGYRAVRFCDQSPYIVFGGPAIGTAVPFSVSYNGSENARAIAVDSEGNVVVNELVDHVAGQLRNCGIEFGKPTRLSVIAADGSKRVLADGIEATALAADASGLVYFATAQGTVGTVTSAGDVTVRAGLSGQAGDVDGLGSDARFRSITALTVSATGQLYVADGKRIRRVSPGGSVTTIADLATLEGVTPASTIPGLAWSAGALYATVRNAVIRIAPVN